MDHASHLPGAPLPTDDGALAAVPVGEAREIMLSQLVAEVYRESEPRLRARLLECLLKPVRPLGLVAVAAGGFSAFLHRESWSRLSVSLDDAVRFTSDQVFELARFVEQVQPEAFQQIAGLMADNPVSVKTLSGTVLLMALRLWRPGQAGDRK